MSWFRGVTLKLALPSLLGFILLLATAYENLSQIASVESSSAEIRETWMRKDAELNALQFVVLRYHTTTIRKVVAVEAAENRDLDQELVEMDGAIPEAFRHYRILIGSPREAALWDTFETRWQGYRAARASILAALTRGDRDAARDAIAPARQPLVDTFGALGELARVNAEGTRLSAERAAGAYRTAWTASIGCCWPACSSPVQVSVRSGIWSRGRSGPWRASWDVWPPTISPRRCPVRDGATRSAPWRPPFRSSRTG